MKQWVLILGQHPGLSLEELLARHEIAGKKMEIIDGSYDFVLFASDLDMTEQLPFLGGTIKIAEWRGTIRTIDELEDVFWIRELNFQDSAEGKFSFGFSQYGLPQAVQQLRRQGLQLKKTFRQSGVTRLRLVANGSGQLSSVAVAKNNLLRRELLVLKGHKGIHLAVTTRVQDFESYGLRDYGRPERDAERGMLPPKVAQMMLNFAQLGEGQSLLDPFCGLGTILQEASLWNTATIYGSDKDAQAVEQAKKNAEWLQQRRHSSIPDIRVATVQNLATVWRGLLFDCIVTEPYLGPAREIQYGLSLSELQRLIHELTDLYMQAFTAFHQVVRPGGRVVMIWPIFHLGRELYDLPLLYPLQKQGWQLLKPQVAQTYLARELSQRGTLVYNRPGQIVAREIVVLRRSS